MNLPPEQEAIRAKCFHPSGTFVEFPKEDVETSIPERFEKVVRINPDRIAVKIDDTALSYDALNKTANRVARVIVDRLGEDNCPIVIFSEQNLATVIFALAIWKSGKIVIAVEPSSFSQEILLRIEAAQANVILTTDDNLSLALDLTKKTTSQIINIDASVIDLADENLDLKIRSEGLAEIRFSSGSTGKPKGVVRSHRVLLNSARSAINSAHICCDDRLVALTNLSFGSHTLRKVLFSGSAIFPFDIKKHGIQDLVRLLNTENITCYESVPSTFRYLVGELDGTIAFPLMRLIQLAGEPLYRSDVESYKNYFPDECILINRLSAGEVGNVCEFFIDKDTTIDTPLVPVGYPAEGKSVFLLNDEGTQIGPNEVGEIAVRSQLMPSGYFNKPDLTEAKYRNDPATGEKVYLTGDLGKVSSDGLILHLGRKDNEVKIRGIKVELSGIDATLVEHEGIAEAVVLLTTDKDLGESLVAYIVPIQGKRPAVGELRQFLRRSLPDYMVPSRFMFLDSLPLTPSGKIDRSALPDPGAKRPEIDTPFVAPNNPIEEQLARIWVDVLALDEVGTDDNFFDLGGHSLAASRVVSRVIQQLQLEIPLQSLFESPTIADMAAVITAHQGKTLDDQGLTTLLNELESLSDEEAQRLVGEQQKNSKV